jgi:hypothetical protein
MASGIGGVDTCAIEDGDDTDDQILVNEGRGGYLYTYLDGSGSKIEPAPNHFVSAAGGAEGTAGALRMQGTLAKSGEVYGGMGFTFTEPKSTYDASKYSGISFLAKKSTGTQGNVRFKIPDTNTDPDGGACKDECFNDFGVDFKVTEEWTRYTVSFADLRQEDGWGIPRPEAVDASKLYGLQWQVVAPGAEFDIWVDDVRFVGCE